MTEVDQEPLAGKLLISVIRSIRRLDHRQVRAGGLFEEVHEGQLAVARELRQLRQAWDRRGRRVEDRLQRLRELLDVVHDRPEELGEERAEVELDVVELDREIVDVAREPVVEADARSEAPVDVEVRVQLRQRALTGEVADARRACAR